MKNCNTCFFCSLVGPNKNGDAYNYCKRYTGAFGFGLMTGMIVNVDEMKVVDLPNEKGQWTPKMCAEWVEVKEQELINKGW